MALKLSKNNNRPESLNLEFRVLRLQDEFPGFLPFKRGERGRQNFIKLTREDEQSYLFTGSNSALRSEIQQALMRLLNEGWTPEGEVSFEFDGEGDTAFEPSYISERIQLEIGRGLLPLLDPQSGAPLLDHIADLRANLTQLLGVQLPKIRIVDNLNLEDNRYLLKIKGAPVFSSELFLERFFAIGSSAQLDALEGWTTQDPILATRAKWVETKEKEKAEKNGCTLLGPLSLMMHHFRTILVQSAAELLGLQDVFDLTDRLASSHPVVAEPFLDNRKALRYFQALLKELLMEGIAIKDLVSIGEVAGLAFDEGESVERAVEQCRKALRFQLCSRLTDDEGQMVGLALGPDLEVELRQLSETLEQRPDDFASEGQRIASEVKKKLNEVSPQRVVCLFTDPDTRRVARKALQSSLPQLAVVATDELAPSIKVIIAGSVTFNSGPEDSLG